MYEFNGPSPWTPDGAVPARVHEGDADDFLRRVQARVTHALQQPGRTGLDELGPCLLDDVSNARNLWLACDHLRRRGGAAPGPNGERLSDLASNELWDMCRALGRRIRSGDYRPGPERHKQISKGPGRGCRTLTLQNIQDRVVARAIAQVTQLLLDPSFDDHSYGYRPSLDRRHAIAHAGRLAADEGRWILVTEDIRDAFDNVPLNCLLDVVHKRLPNADGLCDLIKSALTRPAPHQGAKRGLRQGSPLSPLLLNLYLDHFLDRHWRKQSPDIPLLRSADDLLVLCRSEQEASQARTLLRDILVPAGMPLKDTQDQQAIRNLQSDKAEWLGYTLFKKRKQNELAAQAAESAWDSLEEKLEQAHEGLAASRRAEQTVLGWLDQLGPTYEHVNREQTLTRIQQTADRQAFTELPAAGELERRWRNAHHRWTQLCRGGDGAASNDEGSAARQDFLAAKCRSDGASSHGVPSLSFFPDETVTLHTDGSFHQFTRQGGWAAILTALSLSQPVRCYGPLRRTTNNRAELIAVIKGLERLAGPTQLRICSDSEYVIKGITEHLPKWKAQGWRGGTRRHKRDLRNADLWRVLDALLNSHDVRCQWVRGHAGDEWNEECDRLAKAAAKRCNEPLKMR